MADRPKTPPTWLIDGIGRVCAGLGLLRRSAIPANSAMLEIARGAWLSQAIYAASKLGIFDTLARGPATSDDVARRVGSHPPATYRLLRAPASNSILKKRRDGRFALTRLGSAMCTDAPGIGGRGRTASEYADLLSRTGFRQTRVIPTAGPMSIVEAVPA